jgi:cytochrome c biogenesis protein CcmG/thiol:disulfide interchange protein DsbE
VVGVAYKDRPEASAAFLSRLGDPYARVLLDPDGRGAAEFGVRKVPESFLVGADGRVLAHASGPIDAAFIERHISPLLLAQAS